MFSLLLGWQVWWSWWKCLPLCRLFLHYHWFHSCLQIFECHAINLVLSPVMSCNACFAASYQRCQKVWSCFVHLFKVPFVFMQHCAWCCCDVEGADSCLYVNITLIMHDCKLVDHSLWLYLLHAFFFFFGSSCCLQLLLHGCLFGGSNRQLDKMLPCMFYLSGMFSLYPLSLYWWHAWKHLECSTFIILLWPENAQQH